MSKLEDMMKSEGWVLGYTTNWNVRYFSFRKDGFEIDLRSINDFFKEDDIDGKHFKAWQEYSQTIQEVKR